MTSLRFNDKEGIRHSSFVIRHSSFVIVLNAERHEAVRSAAEAVLAAIGAAIVLTPDRGQARSYKKNSCLGLSRKR